MPNRAMKIYDYEIDLASGSAPAHLLALVGQGKRVLEIGCSRGVQSRTLVESFNCTVTGIEINPDAAEYAKRYCTDVICGNVEHLDLRRLFGAGTFDVIIFSDVLEHLNDPSSVLAKVQPLLARGGFVLASIPNIVHAGVVMEMVRGMFDYREFGLLDDTHVRFFTLKAICKMFEELGYQLNHIGRAVLAPEHSEFAVNPENERERLVLDYIKETNPEWQTYQFVVRAIPVGDGEKVIASELIEAHEKLQSLERQLATETMKAKKAESELRWIQNSLLYRALQTLKGLFR